jgi:hypothetical protein
VTDGIAEVRERSIVTADGREREVDTIVFGTGFRVTDFPIAQAVRGRGGRTLAEVWQGSPRAHRGTAVAGLPNMFFLLGPNTGLGHTSVVVMAEAQADHVLSALRHMRSRLAGTLEVRPAAQREWNADVQRRMRGTVWTAGGCASWYIDRTGANTTLWPGFTVRFRRLLRRFDAESYRFAPTAQPRRRRLRDEDTLHRQDGVVRAALDIPILAAVPHGDLVERPDRAPALAHQSGARP